MTANWVRIVGIVGIALLATAGAARAEVISPSQVLTTFANIAQAAYQDSYFAAVDLDKAIDELTADPNEESLDAARQAWLDARKPFLQTEIYRLSSSEAEAWYRRVNAWPIAPDAIKAALGQGDAISIVSGYHVIEFLLWGDDPDESGADARVASDFAAAACATGDCAAMRAFLKAASVQLLADLKEMALAWAADGAARQALVGREPIDALTMIVNAMGQLGLDELAEDGMRQDLVKGDPAGGQDRFSDNTHNAYYLNAVGIQNVYLGAYLRTDGKLIDGPSLSDYVAQTDSGLDRELRFKLGLTMARLKSMVSRARGGETYEQMIAASNPDGNSTIIAAIAGLEDQTRTIERIAEILGLGDLSFES
jgi:putative iron-regulated protein